MMGSLLRVAALAAMLLPAAARADDAGDIRHLMAATFDRPEAPLLVDPVTVHGDLAIAGWVQGDMGGRALLRKEEGTWELSLCAGDALREAAGLEQLGLPAGEAAALADAVVAAESGVDPARLAQFASFEGIVMMSGDGASSGGPRQRARRMRKGVGRRIAPARASRQAAWCRRRWKKGCRVAPRPALAAPRTARSISGSIATTRM